MDLIVNIATLIGLVVLVIAAAVLVFVLAFFVVPELWRAFRVSCYVAFTQAEEKRLARLSALRWVELRAEWSQPKEPSHD